MSDAKSADQVFKFIVTAPLRKIDENSLYVRATITMTAPQFVFPVRMKWSSDDERELKFAQSELKMKMIEALLAGVWEFEK
jgi:hypothetical protein